MVENMDHVNDKDSGSGAGEPAYKESSRGRRREMNISELSNGGPSALSLLSGSFFLVFSTWGLLNSFGAYQAYYSTAFLDDKSSSAISWIGTIQAFLLEIIGVIVGPIFDRGYFHTLIYAGTFLVVFGMMMLSLCSAYWQVVLTQGICVGLGSGLVFVPSIAVVTAAFTKKRAIAVGIVSSASSLGGIIYPIVFRQLQPRFGYAWATRIIAFIALGTFVVSFAALRDHRAAGQAPRSLIDFQAFRELPFMIYIVALFVLYSGYFVPIFYVALYASAHLHTTSDLAFYLLAVTNAGAFIGRLLPGLFPRPFAAIESLVLASAAAGISVLAWMGVSNLAGFIVFCVVFGMLSGIIITLTTVMVPVLSPKTLQGNVGTRLGMAYAACGMGILIGSPVAGAASHTTVGDFRGAQIWGGATILLGSVLLLYPWLVVKRRKE